MDILTNIEDKKTIFGALAEQNDDDHPHVVFVKNKINKLIKHELEWLGF